MSAPAPSCQDFPSSDPALLVPNSAQVVLGLDIDAFATSSVGQALVPALRSDLQLAETLEVFEDCELELENSYALTLAKGAGDARVAILQAQNIGTTATATCLAAELRARHGGEQPWIAQTGVCHPQLVLTDGGRIWQINDYTVVWAQGSFVDEVAARLEGREAFALPLPLHEEFARLDRSGHLWLAAELSDADRAKLPGPWAPLTSSITAAVDFSAGLSAVFSLSAPDVATSATIRELVLLSFSELAEHLDAYGVPHRVRQRAGVGIVEGVVAASLEFNERELLGLRRNIGEHIRGRGPL